MFDFDNIVDPSGEVKWFDLVFYNPLNIVNNFSVAYETCEGYAQLDKLSDLFGLDYALAGDYIATDLTFSSLMPVRLPLKVLEMLSLVVLLMLSKVSLEMLLLLSMELLKISKTLKKTYKTKMPMPLLDGMVPLKMQKVSLIPLLMLLMDANLTSLLLEKNSETSSELLSSKN